MIRLGLVFIAAAVLIGLGSFVAFGFTIGPLPWYETFLSWLEFMLLLIGGIFCLFGCRAWINRKGTSQAR